MEGITKFEEIQAWQTTRELTKVIYSEAYLPVEKCTRQLAESFAYLEADPRPRHVSENGSDYDV